MAAPQASSRLEMLQARFQQKQLQEKEQKLLQLYDQQQQRAYQVVQRGSAGSNGSNHGSFVSQHTVTRTSSTSHTTSTSQGGKVRQMFDERRQTTVKGIDRSYPLEPLENKPRKQTNGNGAVAQKNGNLTVHRQSVTVKRVARADVNSNLNGGKPVVSYNEEITRESFESPTHHPDDDDDFGNENHVAHYANGNHRPVDGDEVQIEEAIDRDTIDRNRMMAKLHLMEFDETMKHRVRNDLESEEFPEELMVDVPDRLPKRTVTKKLSQAEARLERFKNANAKRNNLLKSTTSTTTVTKKRSEPMFPAKSTSRGSEVVGIGKREVVQKRLDASGRNIRRTERDGGYKTSKSSVRPTEPSRPERGVAVRRDASPQFFCRESERSATTMKIEPGTAIMSSTESIKSRSRASESPDSPFARMKSSPLRTSSPHFDKHSIIREEEFERSTGTRKVGSRSPRTSSPAYTKDIRDRSNSPQFFCIESKKSATTMQIGGKSHRTPPPEVVKLNERQNERSRTTSRKFDESQTLGTMETGVTKKLPVKSTRSVKEQEDIAKQRSASPKYFCRGSERSATTMSIDTLEKRAESPLLEKIIDNRRSGSPKFFCRESERSATTMSIDTLDKRASSPELRKIFSERRSETPSFSQKESKESLTERKHELKTPKTSSQVSAKYLNENRSDSSRYTFERSNEPVAARRDSPKMINTPSKESIRVPRSRSSSPEFFCRESEKSATTISFKPKSARTPSPEFTKRLTKITDIKHRVKSAGAKSSVDLKKLSEPRSPSRESRRYPTPPSRDEKRNKFRPREALEKVTKKNGNKGFLPRRHEILSTTNTSKGKSRESPDHTRKSFRMSSVSPPYFSIESERSSSSLTIKPEIATKPKLHGNESVNSTYARHSEPQFFCKESEKSATTFSLKPKLFKGPTDTPSKSPASDRQRTTKELVQRTNKESASLESKFRTSSKSPESVTRFGDRKEPSRLSPTVLRSTSLIRDAINYQKKDENMRFVKSSNKHDVNEKSILTTKSGSRRVSDAKDTEGEYRFNEEDEVEVFETDITINKRPTTSSSQTYNRPTSESSPKSFTSAEGDGEIQEISMSDRYVKRDATQNTKVERAILKTVEGNTYSKPRKDRLEDREKFKKEKLLTYSVCKPSKKRGSLLDSNIFAPIGASRKDGRPKGSRSSSESKLDNNKESVKRSEVKTVSLKQIIRNKSDAERRYSNSPSPTNESLSDTVKRCAKKNTAEQIRLLHIKNKILSEPKRVSNNFEDAPRVKGANFQSSKRDRKVKYAMSIDNLKSMELVQEAMKKRKFECEKDAQELFCKRRASDESKRMAGFMFEDENKNGIHEINKTSSKTVGHYATTTKGSSGERLLIKEVTNVEDGHDEVDRSPKITKNIIDPRKNKLVPKTANVQNKLDMRKKPISPAKTCSKRHGMTSAQVSRAKSPLPSNVSIGNLKMRVTEQSKAPINKQSSDSIKKDTSKTAMEHSTCNIKDSLHERNLSVKASFTDMSDVENTEMYDEKKHKVLKKQEAVYTASDDEAEIPKPKPKALCRKGDDRLSQDYSRTDSVESALKRFDSIGTESEHHGATRTYSVRSSVGELSTPRTPSSQIETRMNIFPSRHETEDSNVSKNLDESAKSPDTKKTISPKSLDQKKSGESRGRAASEFSKSILRKTPTVAIKTYNAKATPSRSSAATPRTREFPSEKKFAKPRDSIGRARITAGTRVLSCKRRLFLDADSRGTAVAEKSKPKCRLSTVAKNAEDLFSASTRPKKDESRLYSVIVETTTSMSTADKSRVKNRMKIFEKPISDVDVDVKAEISDLDCTPSVKQLRSIEDIRKSIESVSSDHVVSSSKSTTVIETSTSKSAIANESLRLRSALRSEKQSRSEVNGRSKDTQGLCSRIRSQNTSFKSTSSKDSKDLYSKPTRSLRVAKSPSPDRGLGKVTKAGTRTRGNIPSSPSKSPETMARRSSTDLKAPDAKSSRRSPGTKATEPAGSRRTTTNARKSTDVVDGAVFENGAHFREQAVEIKCENGSPPGKRVGDAFTVDFDERTQRESDTVHIRKPLLKKQPSEKQASSTQSARPPSSISSISSGSSTHGQLSGSRSKMATRARTPISGASPSKGSHSAKSAGSVSAADNLVSCKVCGRRFAQERITLHEQICSKSVQKKRKQFDTMMYRVRGTDLEPFVKKGIAKKQNESKPKKPEVKSNWRRKHEDFINAIRSAKQVQAHLAAGGKLSDLPPPPASDTSDYIQCPHCGRKFNHAAAERHIPKCEHMLHNKPAHSRAAKPKR